MKTPLLILAMASLVVSAPAQFDNGGGGGGDDTPAYAQFRLDPNKRVKLDFRNSNVDAVLSFLQRATGITIVKDPGLTGTLTLTSAKSVSLKEALQILTTTLGLKNYELRKEGSLLVIAQRQQRRETPSFDPSMFMGQPEEKSELKVYPIQYANASQVARVVNEVFAPAGQTPQFPQFGGRGGGGGRFGGQQQQGGRGGFNFRGFGQSQGPQVRASADDFSNSIIVNAPSRQQREVSDLLKQIDKQTDAPLRTKVYKLTYSIATDLQPVVQNVLTSNAPKGRGGSTTQQQQQQNLPFFLRGAAASQGQSTVTAEVRSNSLVVTSTEDNLALVQTLVGELDKPAEVASTTFVFPLVNARADNIATLLNQAFGTRSGTGTGNRNLTTPSQQRNATNNASRNNTLGGNNGQGRAAPEPGADADPQTTATTTMDVPLRDPGSDEGELMTTISVAQGGGFGQFFGGQNQQNRNNQRPTTARTSDGRIVNIQDLTNQITVIPDNNTNTLIVVANPDSAQLIQQILGQLDRIPEQVMIETLIVEASLDDTTRLGVEFGLDLQSVFGQKGVSVTGNNSFGLQNANPALNGARYTLSGGQLTAFVNAIKTNSRFNILSTPRIFTSNNQQAQINISQSIPYVLSTRQDINGNLSFNYAFQDVGVVLTVTPRITSNGYVTMDVSQTANDLQGYTSFNAPIVNQREADTSVSVLDGETIVLGGIIRNTVSSTVNKVPLLGDLPLLGNLFRSTTKTNSKTELLVLLTPRIVRDDADARRLRMDEQRKLSPATQKQLNGALPPANGPVNTPKAPPTGPDPTAPPTVPPTVPPPGRKTPPSP